MIKVMVIDAELAPFKEGEIVDIVDHYQKHHSGQPQVRCIQYPNNLKGFPCLWLKRRFIPLSNIDETELIKEREALSENV